MNQDRLTIAQMAERIGVSAHTLRYYERAGLIHAVDRTSGNQRRYDAADIDWVKFLLRLRETRMPIAGMRRYAELRALGESTVAERAQLLREHQQELRAELARMRAADVVLTTKIATYESQLKETP